MGAVDRATASSLQAMQREQSIKLVHGGEVYRVSLVSPSLSELLAAAKKVFSLESIELCLDSDGQLMEGLTETALQQQLVACADSTLKLFVRSLATSVEGIAVRAITHFIVLTKDSTTWEGIIAEAAKLAADCASRCEGVGYKVQTLRIVCNPFGEFLNTSSKDAALADVGKIRSILTSSAMPQGVRIRFALGAATSSAELELVPDLIKTAADLANCCVNISADEFGLPDAALTEAAARCCAALAMETERGEGNFNFTANFNMQPGCPYFPAGYNTSKAGASFALGLEYPNLLVKLLQEQSSGSSWSTKYAALNSAIEVHTSTLAKIAKVVSEAHGVRFAGFDTSAAPSKDADSLCTVFKLLGVPHFGSPGSVECAAFLTRVFKGLKDIDQIGFSGLMLTCLEDAGMAQNAAAGHYDIRALLQYSSVCGIGLDCVPIPGDTSQTTISALMRDTGTLAFRLNKPLTVRLFPVPGKKAGEMTTFQSSDLCNCTIFAVE